MKWSSIDHRATTEAHTSEVSDGLRAGRAPCTEESTKREPRTTLSLLEPKAGAACRTSFSPAVCMVLVVQYNNNSELFCAVLLL